MFYFDDGNSITVYFRDGNAAVWNRDNANYSKVCQLAKQEDWIQIEILHNKNRVLIKADVEVQDDGIKVTTKEGSSVIKDNSPLFKFIQLLKKKGVIDKRIDEIKPFLLKMFMNKHIDAVTEIYEFCTNMDFEITKEGNFLAYKNVNKDLSSIYDGKTKHKVGEYTTITDYCTDRNQVCSKGLHFCSKKYLDQYLGNTTIIVEIDPRDVVSIPTDYNYQKGRCCRYKTVGILNKDVKKLADVEKVSNEVEIVNTSKRTVPTRIQQTVLLMESYKGDAKKVANIMGISVNTVRRNILKAKEKEKNNV